MTFLNPLILLALTAASIPLLLHLLNQRKGAPEDLPTLRFLGELKATRLRSIKLRQLLLLVLRTAVIFFLVLLFAGPVISSEDGPSHLGDPGIVILLVDNSWSIAAGLDGPERWERMVDASRRVIEGRAEGERYIVLPLASDGSYESTPLRHRSESGIRVLELMEPSYGPVSYALSIDQAGQLIRDAGSDIARVVLISDLQSRNYSDTRKRANFARLPENTLLQIVDLGIEEPTTSVEVDSVWLLTDVPGRGAALQFEVWLNAHHLEESTRLTVRLLLDDREQESVEVLLRNGERKRIELRGAADRAGAVAGLVEISGDEILEDNHQYFGVHVSEKQRVAVIANQESGTFLTNALAVSRRFQVDHILPADLQRMRQDYYGSLVVVDPDLTLLSSNTLLDHYRNRGGLVLFGGPNLERTVPESGAISELGLSFSSRSGTMNDAMRIVSLSRDHPLFHGLFDRESEGAILSPRVMKVLPLTSGEPIVSLNNGEPLVTVVDRDDGRIVYMAVPPDRRWSNLTEVPLFLPLLVRSVQYTSNLGERIEVSRVGEQLQFPSSRIQTGDSLLVSTPSGETLTLEFSDGMIGGAIDLPSTGSVGYVVVEQRGVKKGIMGVNGAKGEGSFFRLSDEENVERLQDLISSPELLDLSYTPQSGGQGGVWQLWEFVGLVALLLVLVELFYSNRSSINPRG